MKKFMTFINCGIGLGSLVGVVTELLMGHFGMAWLLMIPLSYSLLNIIAIHSDSDEEE